MLNETKDDYTLTRIDRSLIFVSKMFFDAVSRSAYADVDSGEAVEDKNDENETKDPTEEAVGKRFELEADLSAGGVTFYKRVIGEDNAETFEPVSAADALAVQNGGNGVAGTQLYVQQGTDGAGNPAYVPVTVEENGDPDNAGAKLLTYWFGGDIFSTAPDNEKGTAKWILRNGGYTIQKYYEHSNDSYEPLDGSEDLDTIDLYELKLDENGSPVTNANGEPVYVAVTGDPEDGT